MRARAYSPIPSGWGFRSWSGAGGSACRGARTPACRVETHLDASPRARSLYLLALTLLPLPAPAATPISWWTTHPLAKVKPSDPIPDHPTKRPTLSAARNEFEPFQIILRSATAVQTVDIDFSDLTSATAAIPKENITVYLESYLNLDTGTYPDPLIPRVDRYANEKRNAFPFDLQPARNQPLWVEIFIPPTTPPGQYQGSARLTVNNKPESTIPIHLTIWAFTLPSTSTLKSSFGLNAINILKQHFGKYTNDDDLYAVTRMYTKAALLHRITTHGGSGAPPKFHGNQLDWRTYDAEVAPFLDGTALTKDEPLYGAQWTSVELRTPPDPSPQYLQQFTAHFARKGWLDRLFFYLWDEPSTADRPRVLDRGRAAIAAVPTLRNLLTVPYTEALSDVVHIWVPLVNCLERKPGFDDFCTEAPPLEKYNDKTVWFYQSCASHACNGPGGEYFNGWPSYMIDASGTSNRVMQWIAWKYRIEGELYYSMNEAYAHGDPWTNIRLFNGNGDGTLFYPGTSAHIGGRTAIPIESIRLKQICEGMEDYEYLALYAQKAGRAAAEEFAKRIVTKPYQWEPNAEAFLKVRRELGETLNTASVMELRAANFDESRTTRLAPSVRAGTQTISEPLELARGFPTASLTAPSVRVGLRPRLDEARGFGTAEPRILATHGSNSH